MTYAGIDVGGDRLHCVALGDGGDLVDAALFSASEVDAAVRWARDAKTVAVDAPAALSTAPHGADGSALAAKFRNARCAEIGLGLEMHLWVPWATPPAIDLCSPWMRVGFAVFTALERAGADVIETFPHAAFTTMAGRRLPKKTLAAGASARADLLVDGGISVSHLAMWSHDSLDAAVCAVVARDRALGRAVPATCGHDGSAIWLPAAASRWPPRGKQATAAPPGAPTRAARRR